MGRGEDVAVLHRLADADLRGLLADRDVQEPGRSPARNRSSTFSSKRRMRSISRRKSRRRSSERARFFSTLATPECTFSVDGTRRPLERARGGSCRGLGRGASSSSSSRTPAPTARLGAPRAAPAARSGEGSSRCASRGGDGPEPGAPPRARTPRRERLRGSVSLARRASAPRCAAGAARQPRPSHGTSALATLPADWSDLLAEIELDPPTTSIGPPCTSPRSTPGGSGPCPRCASGARSTSATAPRRASSAPASSAATRTRSSARSGRSRSSATPSRSRTQGPVWQINGETAKRHRAARSDGAQLAPSARRAATIRSRSAFASSSVSVRSADW